MAFDVGMFEEAIDGDAISLNDVEDSVGKAGLLHEFGQEERGAGVFLGWLQDEGVAAGDGVGEHPERHHGGEVERGDAGDDAERLAELIDVNAAAGLFGEAALEEVGDAAGEFDVFEAARDFAEGVGQGLAVFEGDEFGDAAACWPARGHGKRT